MSIVFFIDKTKIFCFSAQSDKCYAVLEDAVGKCIEASYGSCKPVSNWIRGTEKKVIVMLLNMKC